MSIGNASGASAPGGWRFLQPEGVGGVRWRVYHLHGLPPMTATGLKRRLLRWAEKGLCQPDKITVLNHGSINGVAAYTATRLPLTPSRIAALTSRARYPMMRLTEAGFQLSRSLLEDAEAVGAAWRA
jgi:hypothetical protein